MYVSHSTELYVFSRPYFSNSRAIGMVVARLSVRLLRCLNCRGIEGVEPYP